MKFAIPEISWHNRDPVLSVDFQPKCENDGPLRLATGGTDSHVLIWYLSTSDSGSVNIDVAADLTRHQKAVNVVRWSPNGQLLASGDDESIIFIWQQKTEKETAPALEQGEEQYKETWVIFKTLRGHMEDVLDLCWSPDSLHIASGSVDNKLLVWDVTRGRYSSIITDHKGFVQGVAWDPQNNLIASASTDRVFRTFDVNTKKVVSRSSKAVLPFPKEHPLHDVKVRLYHDDTLQTYYRRLQYSPDGLLIAVPAGRIEPEQGKMDMKPINAVYIYTKYSLKVPACILPCGEAALVARWSPVVYSLRAGGPPPAFPGCHRMLLAVATKRSVLLYDTQQKTPLAVISNIHYTRLTDLSWSSDGRQLVASSTDGFCSVITCHSFPNIQQALEMLTDLSWSSDGRQLVASSTDGFCSVITFSDQELGEPVKIQTPAAPMEVEEEQKTAQTTQKNESKPEKAPEENKSSSNLQKIDSFIKFKAPSQKSPKKQNVKADKQKKTPVKRDVLEDAAMPSWSDNSNNEIIVPKPTEAMDVDAPTAVIEIEDSEDIKLVYDEEKTQSAESQTPPENEKTSSENKKTSPENEKTSPENEKTSPERKKESPKSLPSTPKSSANDSEGSNFLKKAKVTDIKEPVAVKAAPSPKAPRRVSFVTLSSPKNTKKK